MLKSLPLLFFVWVIFYRSEGVISTAGLDQGVPNKDWDTVHLGLMVKGYRSDALLLHSLNLLSSGAHAQAVLPCKIGVASSIHIVIYQLPVTYFLSFLHVCSLPGLFAALRHPGPPPHSQTMQSKSLTIHLRSWTDKSDPQTQLFSFLRVRLALERYLLL